MSFSKTGVNVESACQTKHTSRGVRNALLLGSSTLAGAFASPAIAQHQQETSTLEEIIVSATRREQSIMDVPYNISAISGSDIEAANMLDTAELLRSVPGVATVDAGYRNSGAQNGIRIRGLNVDDGAIGDSAVSAVATVSTYVNDTPLFANLLLEDLNRVEVLRGPQATLYGSGTLGGTVRYLVNQPQLGVHSIKGDLSLTSTEGSDGFGYKAGGTFNLPVGDELAVRGTVAHVDLPGIVDYRAVYVTDDDGVPLAPEGPLSDARVEESIKDADTVDIWYTRAGLYWEPSADFNMELNYFHQEDDIGSRRQSSEGADGYGVPYGRYENGSPQLEPSERTVDVVALELELDLGFATLSSSSSYYDHGGAALSDNTGFYANAGFLEGIYFFPRPLASAYRSYREEAFVEEARLASNGDNTIDYIFGLYYLNETRTRRQDSFYKGYMEYFHAAYPDFAFDVDGDQDFLYRYSDDFVDRAIFGEATWNVTDRLHITGGMRYFNNSSEVHSILDLPMFESFSSLTETDRVLGKEDVLFRGNLSYDINDDNLIYSTISEGYRRGGDSAVPSSEDAPFSEPQFFASYSSDSVVNYELGLKGVLAGIRYDFATYYMDWSNPQLNTNTPVWGYYAVINGDEARSMGMELQLSGHFTEAVAWRFGYAYIDAEVTENLLTQDFSGSFTPLAHEGDKLPGVPEHILNVSLDYVRPAFGNWEFVGHMDGYYQSETRNTLSLDPIFSRQLDAFDIWNANIGLRSESLTVSLFVKNITNDEGITGLFTAAFNGPQPELNFYGNSSRELVTLPRSYGLSVSFRY